MRFSAPAGGHRLESNGYFVEPTVLVDTNEKMRAQTKAHGWRPTAESPAATGSRMVC
jgi:hypothetical protein